MRDKNAFHRSLFHILASALLGLSCIATAQTSTNRHVGPGKVVVHPKFGGQVVGFDIDQNGTEGVLSETSTFADVETFDQKTGKILKVVHKVNNGDYVTFGVFGTSVGMVEHEHVGQEFVNKRTYELLNPLSSNQFSGFWTPGFNAKHIIIAMSRNQGTPINAFYVFNNDVSNFHTYVFGSNVAANTFGPMVEITDPNLSTIISPGLGLDTKTNTAVLSQDTGCPVCTPDVGLVDLTTGKVTVFQGVGFGGSVNGLAVDSEDGIACTTTNDDGNVEFYDLAKRTGFSVTLPNGGELTAGADVEYDPIHKLFLIAQPNSGSGVGSSIQVYDTKGNLVESLNGFSFSNFATVIPVHIALNPKNRSGFVDEDSNQNPTSTLRSFTY